MRNIAVLRQTVFEYKHRKYGFDNEGVLYAKFSPGRNIGWHPVNHSELEREVRGYAQNNTDLDREIVELATNRKPPCVEAIDDSYAGWW